MPRQGLWSSGYSHILRHRHPATRVLMLAQHLSVLAQKNIIELFECFRFSCHPSHKNHHQQSAQTKPVVGTGTAPREPQAASELAADRHQQRSCV